MLLLLDSTACKMFLKKKAIVYFVTVLTKIHGDRLHAGQRGGVHAPGRVPQFFHADRSLEKLGCRGGARGVAARILNWCWCWLVLVLVLARVYLALRRPAPCAVAQAVPRVKTIRIWSSSASSLEQSLCVHAQGAAWVAQQGPRFPNTGWGVVSNFGLSLRLVFSRIQPKARRFSQNLCREGGKYVRFRIPFPGFGWIRRIELLSRNRVFVDAGRGGQRYDCSEGDHRARARTLLDSARRTGIANSL